jgi:hypothetical protein
MVLNTGVAQRGWDHTLFCDDLTLFAQTESGIQTLIESVSRGWTLRVVDDDEDVRHLGFWTTPNGDWKGMVDRVHVSIVCVFYCHLKIYCGPSSETMQSPE